MTSSQIFLSAMAAICFLYAVKTVVQANQDKADLMYGQHIAVAIWEFIVAVVCLLFAFTR